MFQEQWSNATNIIRCVPSNQCLVLSQPKAGIIAIRQDVSSIITLIQRYITWRSSVSIPTRRLLRSYLTHHARTLALASLNYCVHSRMRNRTPRPGSWQGPSGFRLEGWRLRYRPWLRMPARRRTQPSRTTGTQSRLALHGSALRYWGIRLWCGWYMCSSWSKLLVLCIEIRHVEWTYGVATRMHA